MTDRTKLKEIFEAAVGLGNAERAAVIANTCNGDDEMRVELERLLAADDAAGGFLESSPFNESLNGLVDTHTRDFVGQKIDAYEIEREIGVGGMGTVFLATREIGEIRQKVAIKIVHQGAHSKEIVRRFLIERKILAGLEHANIARLIDAGETADGLPYLVMEYIDGKPLDEYCRSGDFSIENCLQLFRKVCSAVAYAHRRLVIHRDLKPSNILVTADGEPKLLDFGIAKLLTPTDADTPQTATLMNLLTPAYAAPEQIRGDAVTTATDVYSLGVILYELLAGVRPFSFGNKNYQEIVRVICETEPPKPSEAQTLENKPLTDDKTKVRTERELTGRFKTGNLKNLRGDLDNIILKTLRKDPERRYQAIEQFSDDIDRYLRGLPVSARPDTFTYRASKFYERNRIAAVTGVLLVLAMIGGIVGTTWQAIRAERQRKIAEQRFSQVREIANSVVFKYHDAIANLNGSTDVRQMLVQDATKYLDGLSQDSGADEDLQNETALAYAKLADVQGKPFTANTGDTPGALENYRKSIKLLEGLTLSKNVSNVSRAEEELVGTYHSYSALNSRTANLDEAVSSQKKALVLAQKQRDSDPQDLKKQINYARAILWLGDAFLENQGYGDAIGYYQQALGLAEEIFRQNPEEKGAASILAISHDRVGRSMMDHAKEVAEIGTPPRTLADVYRESYPHMEKTVALLKKIAEENPGDQKYQRNLMIGQSNFGQILRHIGQLDRSLEILRAMASLTDNQVKSDPNNRDLASDHAEDLHQLALTLFEKKESVTAIKNIQAAIQIMNGLIALDSNNAQFRKTLSIMTDDYQNMVMRK